MHYFIYVALCIWGVLAGVARGDTFQMTDGQTLTGDIVTYNENGLVIRLPDGKYSDRVPWAKFSQDDLKKLAENQKIAPLVEPFIEVTQEERVKHTGVPINQPPSPLRDARQAHPEGYSLFGALFSSGLGIFLMLVLYAANIYAAYEVSIFRAQPAALICGLAAIPLLGFLSPIIFLWMPTRVKYSEGEAQVEAAPAPTFAVPGTPAATEATAGGGGGLRLASSETGHGAAGLPETQVFQRGAFTFNRRFFETKFPGFFSMIRREAEKDLVLLIKTPKAQHIVQRITRITGNDMHVQVQKGAGSEEVMVSFSEIQEVQLKHKDA